MEQLEYWIWLLKFCTKVLPEMKRQSEETFKEKNVIMPDSKLRLRKDVKAQALSPDTRRPSKLRLRRQNENAPISVSDTGDTGRNEETETSEPDTSTHSKRNHGQNEKEHSSKPATLTPSKGNSGHNKKAQALKPDTSTPLNKSCRQYEKIKIFTPGTYRLGRALWASCPDSRREDYITFILSFCSLTEMLEACCSSSDIHSDGYSRRLYSILSSAVDLSTPMNSEQWQYLCNTGLRGETAVSLAKLCNQCRSGMSMLPSYWEAAPRIKKYLQLYIDFQTYKNYPNQMREEYLSTWSGYYTKKYDGICWWEFCAASDSLLGIIAMCYAAADAHISTEEISLIDEACFPWLCGLESLLRSYIANRMPHKNDTFDYTLYYDNLKVFEERLVYVASKAEASFSKLKDKNYFSFILKAMTGLYLSDPQASFGMHHLSTDSFLSEFPSVKPYYSICKLMRQFHFIKADDSDTQSPSKYQGTYPC